MSKNAWAKITWPKNVRAQSLFWAVKTELKANRASEIEEQRKERLHCKKKKRAMHTKYGVLRLSRLEHLIWREVTPDFWCVFYTKLSVLSHQLSVFSH